MMPGDVIFQQLQSLIMSAGLIMALVAVLGSMLTLFDNPVADIFAGNLAFFPMAGMMSGGLMLLGILIPTGTTETTPVNVTPILLWIGGAGVVFIIALGIVLWVIDDNAHPQPQALQQAHQQALAAMHRVAERIALLDTTLLSPHELQRYEIIAIAFADLLQSSEDPRTHGHALATYTRAATQCQTWLHEMSLWHK